MRCQYCKSSCVKYGRQKSGVQKYLCKLCRKFQQEEYTYNACINDKKQLILPMCRNNCGIRGIARVLNISTTTVIRIIKEFSSKMRPPNLPYNGIYEVDEIKSYCGNRKNDIWIAYGIERKTGKITEINAGKRTKHTLKKVINSILISAPKKIYTDGLIHYKGLIPENIHVRSSSFLNKIERNHLSVRNALKRFNRRTIGFSKSVEMTIACLKLFLWQNDSSFCPNRIYEK